MIFFKRNKQHEKCSKRETFLFFGQEKTSCGKVLDEGMN